MITSERGDKTIPLLLDTGVTGIFVEDSGSAGAGTGIMPVCEATTGMLARGNGPDCQLSTAGGVLCGAVVRGCIALVIVVYVRGCGLGCRTCIAGTDIEMRGSDCETPSIVAKLPLDCCCGSGSVVRDFGIEFMGLFNVELTEQASASAFDSSEAFA